MATHLVRLTILLLLTVLTVTSVLIFGLLLAIVVTLALTLGHLYRLHAQGARKLSAAFRRAGLSRLFTPVLVLLMELAVRGLMPSAEVGVVLFAIEGDWFNPDIYFAWLEPTRDGGDGRPLLPNNSDAAKEIARLSRERLPLHRRILADLRARIRSMRGTDPAREGLIAERDYVMGVLKYWEHTFGWAELYLHHTGFLYEKDMESAPEVLLELRQSVGIVHLVPEPGAAWRGHYYWPDNEDLFEYGAWWAHWIPEHLREPAREDGWS